MESRAVTIRVTEDGGIPAQFTGTNVRVRCMKKTVAIIEDEKDIVDLYSKICESMGLKVSFVAYDGLEGLETFKNSFCPDVILIDHRMPAMTGLEAMRAMLDVEPEARFVFLSASQEVQDDALEAGARAFLMKPALMAEIKNTISRVLDEP
ncbi:MAG TPA: response regulator [Methanocella sp.]|uniref:response regulator n=1 Tax=Methanocella sp. TaxID=2052833 RepID=UPI002BA8FA13|nr:response regulator [Methanocella sp.]HTY90806.1 response regulator [Methanocella sp.]